MYSGVPIDLPGGRGQAPRDSICVAMPKSMRRTMPRASRMMFGVLRSRWMTPASWMAASPSAIWMAAS